MKGTGMTFDTERPRQEASNPDLMWRVSIAMKTRLPYHTSGTVFSCQQLMVWLAR